MVKPPSLFPSELLPAEHRPRRSIVYSQCNGYGTVRCSLERLDLLACESCIVATWWCSLQGYLCQKERRNLALDCGVHLPYGFDRIEWVATQHERKRLVIQDLPHRFSVDRRDFWAASQTIYLPLATLKHPILCSLTYKYCWQSLSQPILSNQFCARIRGKLERFHGVVDKFCGEGMRVATKCVTNSGSKVSRRLISLSNSARFVLHCSICGLKNLTSSYLSARIAKSAISLKVKSLSVPEALLCAILNTNSMAFGSSSLKVMLTFPVLFSSPASLNGPYKRFLKTEEMILISAN